MGRGTRIALQHRIDPHCKTEIQLYSCNIAPLRVQKKKNQQQSKSMVSLSNKVKCSVSRMIMVSVQ